MGEMMRDFGNMKKEYAGTAGQEAESALATSLEQQQQGAQFRIIDPPRCPTSRTSPTASSSRWGRSAPGLALAMLFGFGVEFLDDRIRGEQALTEAIRSADHGGNPAPVDPKGVAPGPWVPRLAIAASMVLLILLPSGVAYVYYWG